jgi:hypothetical protein
MSDRNSIVDQAILAAIVTDNERILGWRRNHTSSTLREAIFAWITGQGRWTDEQIGNRHNRVFNDAIVSILSNSVNAAEELAAWHGSDQTVFIRQRGGGFRREAAWVSLLPLVRSQSRSIDVIDRCMWHCIYSRRDGASAFRRRSAMFFLLRQVQTNNRGWLDME